jgi:Xaa-Pro aminopeptidase
MERRWKLVREAMKKANLDFLLMQNFTQFLGGHMRWFTDLPDCQAIVFPLESDMVIIKHGPAMVIDPGMKGIKKQINVPWMPSLDFIKYADAEAAAAELKQFTGCRIGLYGLGYMTAAFHNYLTTHLGSAVFSDATDLVDGIKAIKSDEELSHLKTIAALQDNTFKYALTIIKPGRRDFEVFGDLYAQCIQTGSEQVNMMVGSAPAGTPIMGAGLHDGNRMMREGDQVSLLIESNGSSGYYTEIMRCVCLGKIPKKLGEQFEVVKILQEKTLSLLKPGVSIETIWDANNKILREAGYSEEKRLLFHGMGLDMVERPSVQPGETMKIGARMNIAGHATVVSGEAIAALCENYFVTNSGIECLHNTPKQIFIV